MWATGQYQSGAVQATLEQALTTSKSQAKQLVQSEWPGAWGTPRSSGLKPTLLQAEGRAVRIKGARVTPRSISLQATRCAGSPP